VAAATPANGDPWSWRAGVAVGAGMWGVLIWVIVTVWYFTRNKENPTASRDPVWLTFIQKTKSFRTWIIQEIALSQTVLVHCGDDCQGWTELIDSCIGDYEDIDQVLANWRSDLFIPDRIHPCTSLEVRGRAYGVPEHSPPDSFGTKWLYSVVYLIPCYGCKAHEVRRPARQDLRNAFSRRSDYAAGEL
jgi:hypothetical protein